MKVYQMLAHLRAETSSKKSLEFVISNPECHEVLRYLCNPYIRTGLSNVPLEKETCIVRNADKLTVELVEYFKNCGPDGTRFYKTNFAQKIFEVGPKNDKDWKWFVELIATHGNSSAFGVGPNTLKKAGIDVPIFGCQLGSNIDDVGADYLDGKRWRISEKVDGTRRLFIKKSGYVECFSRSGKQDVTFGHICDWFSSNEIPDNRIYDCEIVDQKMFDTIGTQSFEVRAKSIGQASRKSGDKSGLIAVCFDYYDFDNPQDTTLKRTRELKSIFDSRKTIDVGEPVRLVRMFGRMDGYQQERLDAIFDEVVGAGGEGLMLQELSSPYVFERTKNLVKYKRLEDFVGELVGISLGKIGTRLEGSCAAIKVRVEGCDSIVSVGTGLSDTDRKIFAKHWNGLIGSIIEVEAFSKTVDKNGKTSLCFPVFKRCQNKLFESE